MTLVPSHEYQDLKRVMEQPPTCDAVTSAASRKFVEDHPHVGKQYLQVRREPDATEKLLLDKKYMYTNRGCDWCVSPPMSR